MQRLGRNRDRYEGETLEIRDVLREASAVAHAHGWREERLPCLPGLDLPAYVRAPSQAGGWTPRIYLSSGIHGDEPAGPLAAVEVMRRADLPSHAWLWCLPCLNPTGFPRNTRASAAGIDLNRDYRSPRSAEIQGHTQWLQQQPLFDLTLCLHEDWEATGFYVYELNPGSRPSLAPALIDAVRDLCPIDLSPQIDGRDAQGGIIRPTIDPVDRPEWPEALYLLQHKTRLSYTLESPSDFPLKTRVEALVAASLCALQAAALPQGPN